MPNEGVAGAHLLQLTSLFPAPFAVSLLRQETTYKRGVNDKRPRCALDSNYLLKVLHTAKF